jgi:dihydrofolate reductase
MRRLAIFDHVTPEGYFAAADGNLDWFVHDEEVAEYGMKGFPRTDTILFGRKTYEMMAGFWPHAADRPDPHPSRQSASIPAMAKYMNETQKVVFSRTLKAATWSPTRILREVDASAIEAMKREPGKDMIVLGSGSITSQLAELGLIDDFEFLVDPVLLGAGRPLFRDVTRTTRLELVDVKRFRSGNVLLTYTRVGQGR